jgi:NAD(P)-dependent dehydrogenase (short-subunit alcohol dehydrogenase family)
MTSSNEQAASAGAGPAGLVLAAQVVIITGAAQGIGAVLARALAERGACVALADVADPSNAADVTRQSDCEAMVARTVEAFGSLTGLVCNAALFATLQPQPFDAIPVDEWDRVMAVNVRGPWLCARAAAPAMEQSGGGSIVMIGTNRTFMGFPMMLHYDASKGAVVAMTRSLARELGPRGIRINTVAPGLTMSEGVLARSGIESRNAAVVQGRALGRTQQPQDLVGAVSFFLSRDSGFVCGQSLIVDGGGILN